MIVVHRFPQDLAESVKFHWLSTKENVSLAGDCVVKSLTAVVC
jgi:hypothetical protein